MPTPSAPEVVGTLAADALTVVRARRDVLRNVSIRVAPGEIVAIIGPNGAGKTTLLETMVGFIRPTGGTVTFAGRRITSLRDASRVFSYLRDDAEPAAEVLVQDIINLAQDHGGSNPAKATALMERLGVAGLRKVRGGALSRGERRRVALCAALLASRPMVVLDEPLGVFDPLQVLDVCAVLRAHAATGTGVLLTAHQMSDAEKVATRVMLLDAGREIATGSIDELRDVAGTPAASLEEIFLTLLRRSRRDAVA